MATICDAAPAAPAPPAVLGRHRPMSRAGYSSVALLNLGLSLSQAPLVSRFNDAIRLQAKQRLSAALAQGPSGGDSIDDKSDGITRDDVQGPPIATILAGFLVFALFCWVFGSIITWLFSLILKLFPK